MSNPSEFRSTASIETLQQRAHMLKELRDFFHEQGYWEVETPLLSRDTCVDAWIDPYSVIINSTGQPWFLQTSPEFAMKRLLACGADSIFQFTRSFRAGEQGTRHNHEFGILEWYRTGVDHHHQMEFTEQLVRHAKQAANKFSPAGSSTLPESIPRLTYDDAFLKFAGTRVLHLNCGELFSLARQFQLSLPAGLEEDRDGILNLLLAEVVEPCLASMGAVFLFDYPDSQSALARIHPGPPPVAERFELYLNGIELCNGYHELVDPVELRQRFERQNRLRGKSGKSLLPIDSKLIEAMQSGLPPCSGVALGIDRLVMWALNLQGIADVIPFPMDRA